jgi:membrane fusion protein
MTSMPPFLASVGAATRGERATDRCRRAPDLLEHERLASTAKGIEGEIAQLEDQRNIQNERLKLSESYCSDGRHAKTAKGALPGIELKRRETGGARASARTWRSARSADHCTDVPKLTDARHYARATSDRLPQKGFAYCAERISPGSNRAPPRWTDGGPTLSSADEWARGPRLQATVGKVADPKHNAARNHPT